MSILVRPEVPADFEAVAQVVEAAFGRPNEARLVELIRASDRYVPDLALVAEEDGAVVGYAMLSYVALEGERELSVLALAPVAVAPAKQGCGTGSAIIRAGIEKADARGEPIIVVLGHPGYYPRFGFAPARDHAIEPPSSEVPDAAFMVLPLAAYEEKYRGRIRYPAAFGVT